MDFFNVLDKFRSLEQEGIVIRRDRHKVVTVSIDIRHDRWKNCGLIQDNVLARYSSVESAIEFATGFLEGIAYSRLLKTSKA